MFPCRFDAGSSPPPGKLIHSRGLQALRNGRAHVAIFYLRAPREEKGGREEKFYAPDADTSYSGHRGLRMGLSRSFMLLEEERRPQFGAWLGTTAPREW